MGEGVCVKRSIPLDSGKRTHDDGPAVSFYTRLSKRPSGPLLLRVSQQDTWGPGTDGGDSEDGIPSHMRALSYWYPGPWVFF